MLHSVAAKDFVSVRATATLYFVIIIFSVQVEPVWISLKKDLSKEKIRLKSIRNKMLLIFSDVYVASHLLCAMAKA